MERNALKPSHAKRSKPALGEGRKGLERGRRNPSYEVRRLPAVVSAARAGWGKPAADVG